MNLLEHTVLEHGAALEKREYSSEDLTRACLSRIAERDGRIGAFLTVDEEGAIRAARASDARRANGCSRGILDGIPFSVKDNFCTEGLPTTCASRMLDGFVSPYRATVVERLQNAGCILIGKNNMDEFAMGSSNALSAFYPAKNPHNPDYVTGGSSGGSAAAVAYGAVPFSIGSDTGGSVRQPAAFCGVVGLKPTYGVISRYGLTAMASTLDCVGIFAGDTADCGAVLTALVGKDQRDATTVPHPCTDFSVVSNEKPKRLRVAVCRDFLNADTVSEDILQAMQQAIAQLLQCGAETEEIALPSPDLAVAAYCVLMSAEVSSNMARYDGVRYGKCSSNATDLVSMYAQNRAKALGSEVKRRVLFGAYMLSETNRTLYYDRACEARSHIQTALMQIFAKYDLILTPTAPTAAFPFGTNFSQIQQRRADLCAVYANLAGLPAVSVPFGMNREGLPLAVQLTGAPFSERLLLQTAYLLENSTILEKGNLK